MSSRFRSRPHAAYAPRNPYGLYRDPENGRLAGVCAGLAEYIGVEPLVVRLALVLCLIFFTLPTLIAYAAMTVALKPRPPGLDAGPEDEAFWRTMEHAPAEALHGLARQFRDLDERVARMESLVTSPELELRRGFRDLG